MNTYNPESSYLRVATACPEVGVADVRFNIEQISALYQEASKHGAAVVVFPELSITGYSLGDLVRQHSLLRQATAGLAELKKLTAGSSTALIAGLPLQVANGLYNCAAVVSDGDIKGIVPKSNLPTYGEFYEKRWFQTWNQPNTTVKIDGVDVPFGTDLLFDIDGVKTGVEICEDLWVNNSPSHKLTDYGALLIANPSASPELVAKAAFRRDLVRMQSAKLMGAYAYAGCDWTESTMDVVMGGHQLIAENGRITNERLPFTKGQRLLVADIDIDRLLHDRRKDSNFVNKVGLPVITTTVSRPEITPEPAVNPHPFLPGGESAEQRGERLQSIINIQAHALARRIIKPEMQQLHLGLSGGLDSTLAFLVAIETAKVLGREPKDILRTYTMPGEASSDRTQSNALKLAELFSIPNEVIPIGELSSGMLKAISHGDEQDVTYENAQARMRTSILLNKANQMGGIVLGTGDLSEIALGWCTYNGDHISHYHVNAGVPKTLVRHLVEYVSRQYSDHSMEASILDDILATPVSPELVKAAGSEISQKTEDIIGPYELHDFFMYQLVRWGDEPAKISFLAKKAFADTYEPEVIDKWLNIFIRRFTFAQFKRSVMPDGAKVGSVAFSPRGDWRMPSDLLNSAVWQD